MKDDTISRQATIDICNFAIDFWRGQLGEGIVIAVRKRIEQLPVVQPQPEIIQCKDCKHWGKRGLCEIWDYYISNEDFYCGCAKRRTE